MQQSVSTIAGVINGAPFMARGQGFIENGQTKNRLDFMQQLERATPMMCSSWSCKHHKSYATFPNGAPNPLAVMLDQGVVIVTKTQALYPDYNGEIECVARILRTGGIQLVEQTRLGAYEGPVDIIAQNSYSQEIRLVSPGLAVSDYERTVVRANGEHIMVRYVEEIQLPIMADFQPFRVHYNVLSSSFDGRTFLIEMRPTAEWIVEPIVTESTELQRVLVHA